VPSWIWIVSLCVICLVLVALIAHIGCKARDYKTEEQIAQDEIYSGIYTEDRNSLLGAAALSGNAINNTFTEATKNEAPFAADGVPQEE
jgi:hypothetical protein